MKKTMKQAATILALMLLFTYLFNSCAKQIKDPGGKLNWDDEFEKLWKTGYKIGHTSPEIFLRWNDAASYVVLRTVQLQPAPRISPFRESHYYACVNLAIHDALNNIVPRYKSYSLNARDMGADADAAVAQAAHDVINYFFGKLNPPASITPQSVQDSIHNLLAQTLNAIPDGNAKTKGIALGAAAAQAVIQKRLNDGSANANFPIVQGTLPGEYRSTPPFTATGFYDSPGWGDVKTFGILSSTQFPVAPPYAITSNEYTADYNEVKAMGCANCTGTGGRTPDEENIARFWVESSAYGWNKIARELISQRNLDAWKTVRLLSLVQMSIADAYISCLKYKMTYFFWRPYTAIQLGESDGNALTVGDPAWQVLVAPIPPIADHPSAHATAGAAAAEAMRQFFDKDDFRFSFSSITLPGNPREFNSLSQAARENSLSRIYVGYHFRNACMEGESLGKRIGNWVAIHSLAEN